MTEPDRGSGSGSYLDAAATAPLRPEALDAMLRVFTAGQANASSVHSPGFRAREEIEAARARVAAALGARPGDVIFTSGGTEANSLAIVGLSLASPRGRHLVTTAIEHSSVLESCRYLERVFGFELTVLPVDGEGRVGPADLRAALRTDTTLVSVGLANGEVGTVQDVPALAALAREIGAIVHTDAVQAAASLPVSVGAAGAWPGGAVDALTVASHKFGGPQGVGALVARSGLRIEPIIHGGGQERGARSGPRTSRGSRGSPRRSARRRRRSGRPRSRSWRAGTRSPTGSSLRCPAPGSPGIRRSGCPVTRRSPCAG